MRKLILFFILLFHHIAVSQDLNKIKILQVASCASFFHVNQHEIQEFLPDNQLKAKLAIYRGIAPEIKEENTLIYVYDDALKEIKDINPIKKNLNDFLGLLSKNIEEFKNERTVFTITSNEKGEELVIFLYHIDGKLYGFLHKPASDKTCHKDLFEKVMKSAKEEGNLDYIYWYGDEISYKSLYEVADNFNIELLRRSKYVNDKMLPTKNWVLPIEKQKFIPEVSTVINAIPDNRVDIAQAGFSPDGEASWKNFKSEVANLTKGKFKDQITTKDALKEELINGNSDVLLIVAHSNKISIYLNGESISLKEMQTWEAYKGQRNKPRVGILLSCYTGESQRTKLKWLLFREQRLSLTEVLLQKRYFDIIVSPDHEIKELETIQVLAEILKAKSVKELREITNAGWHSFVQINKNENE